jgi:hypothetical protein
MSTPHVNPLDALKGGFRKACVKRLVGDESGAVEVLRDEIPKLVVAWAKSTSLEAAEKKAKLKELFDDESSRAEELAVAFDLFAGRFETRVATIVRDELSKVAGRLEALAGKLDEASRQIPAEVASVDDGDSNEEGFDSAEENWETDSDDSDDSDDSVEADELDPPRGIGLRFDEIEQMIDEVLETDDS